VLPNWFTFRLPVVYADPGIVKEALSAKIVDGQNAEVSIAVLRCELGATAKRIFNGELAVGVAVAEKHHPANIGSW
jgi:hypothetical protein